MRTPVLLSMLAMAACSPAPAPSPPPNQAAALMTWDDFAKLPRPKADLTLRYGDDPYQVVDLWLPARGERPAPVILMVHGGCWTTGIADRSLMNPIAADLRARGFAVWNIDYRGVDRPGGGYPGTFADAAAAADLLRAQAAAHRLSLDHVVAVGHSAGGHLALWLAGRARLPAASPLRSAAPLAIAGVVSLGGLPDLEQARAEEQGCGAEVVDQLVGAEGSRVDRFIDTSVPRLAPLGVPQILVNGDSDRIIPVAFAKDYAAKMRAAGDTVGVEIVPRTGHVELITPTSAAWQRTLAAIERLRR